MTILTRLRLWLIAAILALVALLAMQNTAFAQDDGAPILVEDAGNHFVLSPFLWKTITGILLPIVVYFVTKANGSAVFKGVVAIVVAAVDALIIRWTALDGSMLFDQAALQDIFHVYGIQMLIYLGVLRKTGLDQRIAPNFGLG